jgi:uncharacterized protein (DUF1810 family)
MPHDLDRFVAAQAAAYAQALAELRRGRKESHWMWFVFPQLRGLGRSPTAQFYGLAGLDEARAYVAHPVLGPRLRECAQALLSHASEAPEAILGAIDALKLRSSMTLFERAADDPAPFAAVLEAFYGGERDAETLRLLAAGGE